MRSKALGLLALLLCALSCLYAAPVQFGSRIDIPTKFTHLTGLAIADFNGDGKLDIAVTDDYAQSIVVYLNDGTGNFSNHVSTTLTVKDIGGLGALVAGDVNEDGKQDLIVGPVAGAQYDIVLLGNGDGTFTQGERIPGSYGILSSALLDVNGDKHLDLLSGADGSVYVQLGDGKGNFTQQPVTTVSGLYLGLTAGDFEGNKHNDFVTTDFIGGKLSYYSGLGDGTFQNPVTFQPSFVSSPSSLTSADFNGDGKLDLLVASADIATLIFGNGDGTFQTSSSQVLILPLALPVSPGPSPQPQLVEPVLATADMDGNGTPDVVAADDSSNMLSVLLNDGTGTFAQVQPDFTAALDSGSGGIQLADLNGDGLPDIIITNYKTQNISIFLSIAAKTQPSIAIQSSAVQTLIGNTVTISVQVKGTGSKTPSGTVGLTSGTTFYGQQTLDSSGTATFALSRLAAGQYSITASYSGDGHYQTVTNPVAFTQMITDFQVALPSATQSTAIGSSATYPVNLTPLSGFTGPVILTCSGLPTGYTCATVSTTLSAQASTANLVVSPPAISAAFKDESPFHPLTRTAAICASLCLCLISRKRRKLLSLMMIMLVSVGAVLGCSSNTPSSKATAYTGTSSFIITASATQGSQTASHQVTATLTVH